VEELIRPEEDSRRQSRRGEAEKRES
jgi:hypothetical protein